MRAKVLMGGLLFCILSAGIMLLPGPVSAAVPAAPSHLIAVAGDATSIALSWHDNSTDEVNFFIYRKAESEASFSLIDHVGANHVIYGDSGLQPGTKYYYKIKAYNSSGTSDFSNTASDTTEEAEVNLTSPNGGEVWKWNETHNITWTSNGEGFEVRLAYKTGAAEDWIPIALVPNTNSYSWTVPNENTAHARVEVCLVLDGTIVARDRSYNDFTIEGFTLLFVIPLESAPAAPSDLTWSYHIPTITLNWHDNSTNETGFRIERKIGSEAYTELGTVGENVTTYDDDITPTLVTSYTYRVRAYNSAGNSSYSNETVFLNAEVVVIPLPPLNLTAAASSDSIILNWESGGVNDGLEVERRTGSGAFVKIADTASDAVTYTDTGVSPETAYTYRIRAFNEDSSGHRAYSIYSNEANAAVPAVTVEPPETSETSGQTVLRFYIDSTEYYVQGPSDSGSRLQTMDTAPIISGSRTLLPIRYVAEPLGAGVGWDAALDQVTVQLGSQTIVMWINNGTARINDVETAIDPSNPAVTPIIVPPGRTMLPLRFIAENLGCRVEWDPELREVTVIYPGD